jgi:4-diphosphocytidyl-2-C-methyl-D-erythritol kinase
LRIARSGKGWIIDAPAKVNLFLEVLGRRPDGFHDLDTIMLAIDLSDRLTFLPRADRQLSLELTASTTTSPGTDTLPTDRRNLVIEALATLRERLGITAGAHVQLAKSIPIEAGLGGGSTDAAAALVGGQLLWSGRYNHTVACEIAAKLGSDVNFFLEGGGAGSWCARCRGRGELVQPLPLGQGDGSIAKDPHMVVAMPPTGCSTAAIFRQLTTSPHTPRDPQPLLEALAGGYFAQVPTHFFNRLQAAACQHAPAVERLLQAGNSVLEQVCAGVPYACAAEPGAMTGSGAASFWWLPQKLAEHLATSLPKLMSCRVWIAKLWSAPELTTAARAAVGASELKGSLSRGDY